MRKTLLWIIIPVILISSGLILFFNVWNNDAYEQNMTFRAVPELTPLVIEIPSVNHLINHLQDNENDAITELKQISSMQKFWDQLQQLKKLMADDTGFGDIIRRKSLLGAFNIEGKNNIGCVWMFSLKNRSEKRNLDDFLLAYSKRTGLHIGKRIYDGTTVYELSGKGSNGYTLAEKDGIVIFSHYSIFVDASIRQLSTSGLMNNASFNKLYETAGHDSDFNLYINHQTIGQLLSGAVNYRLKSYISLVQTYADWTELDVNLDRNELLFSGFTFSQDRSANYINLFKNQDPSRFQIDEILPANTSSFLNIHLSDFQNFQDSYTDLLKKQRGFYTRDTRFIRLEKYTHGKFISFWREFLDNDFAEGTLDVLKNDPAMNRFFVAKVKSRSLAEEKLIPLIKSYAEDQKIDFSSCSEPYKIQGNRQFIIYKFPIPDLPRLFFGKFFSGVSANYLCFYDRYLIFTDNMAAMKQYLHNLVLGETLENDRLFTNFNQEMASQSSVYCYFNFYRMMNMKNEFLSSDLGKVIGDNENRLRKFFALGWQFGSNSDAYLNNGYLNYIPGLKEAPQTVWQSKLDSSIFMKPQLVINHNDRANKEIIVQDQKHCLYLLSKDGVILWKLPLNGPIIGKIYQIDYYRNRKLQYLFATKNRIYLIDRNGNRVGHFPVSLRSSATNGIAVFDYNNNRDYRYVIAGSNRKIYVYDRDGRIVSGWDEPETEGIVSEPVRFFRVDNKDYIVCSDRYRTYIYNRKGDIRVNVRDHFEHSDNGIYLCSGKNPSLATTDKNGMVHLQYFDGHFETIKLDEVEGEHTFEAADLNGDGTTEFIVGEKNHLKVFSLAGKLLFDKDLDAPISGSPNIYQFSSKDKRIGLVCKSKKEVYLFDNKGQLVRGFPLQGNTEFTIGYLNKANPYFNLIVGSSDGSIFNYKIENH